MARLEALRAAVTSLAQELAQMIVRDGEGATKLMTIRVEGGKDVAECRQIAYAVAHSPLVKTAFYASDPNLGRILAAVATPAWTTSMSTASTCGSTTSGSRATVAATPTIVKRTASA